MFPVETIRSCLATAAALWAFAVFAESGPALKENKGQWHPDVAFRAELGSNAAFIDRGGITLLLTEADFSSRLHDHIQGRGTRETADFHCLKIRFSGADLNSAPEKRKRIAGPEHYFLGSDPHREGTDVYGYEGVTYRNVYPGTDARFDVKNGRLKYEFVLAPGADPDMISVEISGADSLYITGGALAAATSVGTVREEAPFAFQRDAAGKTRVVACEYRLSGNRITYAFPEGYDPTLPLVIDPEISFSTYIGSTSSNFGFTASYDDEGNLYAGAIVFGANYPTTTGAFQVDFAGANVDCAITKFSADGTELLYSTFLGGNNNEAPHSIVVSPAGEAYILGTTGSPNFPTSLSAFQTGFNGGDQVNTGIGFSLSGGTDMFVAKLSPGGNILMASTFVGGSGNDGISVNTPFNFNYGDLFRGEIVIDPEGNPCVASVTNSADFPSESGYSSVHSGEISGVVFKLNNDLSQMLWSTYTGGNADETAVGLQLAADNSVYFTGGTFSTDLATPGAFQAAPSGAGDGYVGHISADGSALLSCTYTGTSEFDLNYFVQIDEDGFVYTIGQSLGNYPVQGDVYSNANSSQFIQKLSPDLEDGIWSTVVGAGSGGVDFSPSAFLVSECGQVYVAGWGGTINDAGGTTTGLPVTPDAFQTTTDGNDFYVMVLAPDAEDLAYATFFGGSQSQEHVDGGTSRFDKNGTVYQAVCAGCGGNSDFPTQQGVWSQTNNSNNCNLAVFKFILSSVQTAADIEAPETVCPGTELNFINLTTDADNYLWDFGDGNQSTEFAPTYSYETDGDYTVWLYADSDDGCLAPDSVSLTVQVLNAPVLEAEDPDPICPGESVQLFAEGADTYVWSPSNMLDDNTSDSPIFSGTSTTVLTLTGNTACGSDQTEITVTVGSDAVQFGENTAICPGESAELFITGAQSVLWSPEEGLDDPESFNPTATPSGSVIYTFTAVTDDECDTQGQVEITVLPPPPVLEGSFNYVACNGIPAQINISGAESYSWSPSEGLSADDVPDPAALPESAVTYTVTGTNACGSATEEVSVLVNSIQVNLIADSMVCHRDPFTVSATGGKTYIWQPGNIFTDPEAQTTQASVTSPTLIKVTGFDETGCSDTQERWVMLYPRPFFTAGRDRTVFFGDDPEIESNSPYPISWEPNPALSCTECNFPTVRPREHTVLYAFITDENGCTERDSVRINIHGNLYVPNAFTPDGDGVNDIFKAEGTDITYFRMEVYNRWGQQVFASDHIDRGWNGSAPDSEYYAPADVYRYRIVAREKHGEQFEVSGHVTLLR